MSKPRNPDYFMTYQEIALVMGISRIRVQQLEASALAKLRDRFIMRQYYLDLNSSSESHGLDRSLSV